jgi:predicted helicase
MKVASVSDYASAADKAEYLVRHGSISAVNLQPVPASGGRPWTGDYSDDFSHFVGLGSKEQKGEEEVSAFFREFGGGVKTNRDAWAYNMSPMTLRSNMRRTIEFYNSQVARRARGDQKIPIDESVDYEDRNLSWSRDLKGDLVRGRYAAFSEDKVRRSMYRPFTLSFLYFDRMFNEEVYLIPRTFPNEATESENIAIMATVDPQIEFSTQAVDCIPCLHVGGRPSQCFPFYTYSEDGSNRRENITDWALEQFRAHYHDPSISKWDIFHYVYAVLHHPEYRARYAANLKRELPRIPFLAANVSGHDFSRADQPTSHHAASAAGANNRVEQGFSPADSGGKTERALAPEGLTAAAKADLKTTASTAGLKACATQSETQGPSTRDDALARDDKSVFWKFADAGKRLADIHVHYEQQPEYPLEKLWNPTAKLDYRVTKMRLSNKDKSILFYNDSLTLKGIPLETYEYRLGNRSALEWVIDQYQVSTDKRSGITDDPNRADDREYILRLIGQAITLSLETVQIVKSLPEFVFADSTAAIGA